MEYVSATVDHVLVDPKRPQAGRAAAVVASPSEPVPAGVQELQANSPRTALPRKPTGCLVAEDDPLVVAVKPRNKEVRQRPSSAGRLAPSPDR